MTTKSVPAVPGLFTETADGPRLLGSKCGSCGTPYFPKSAVCHHPDCKASKVEDASFGPRGKLWSCAIQNFPPPAPAKYEEPYKPYAIGLVDLSDGLRVLGRIRTDDPDGLQVGTDVELVLGKLGQDEDGTDVISWMFRPV